VSADSLSLGFDVGGQSVKAVAVSPTGEIVSRAAAPTGEGTDPETLADTLEALREDLLRQASGVKGSALDPMGMPVGVGIAGVTDRSGTLRGSPHLPLLTGSKLGSRLSMRLRAMVVVHNDADCAAMAEGWGGSVDGIRDYLLLTIGTGIGSGLVLGGKLRAGDSGYGSEFGHMVIVHGGLPCGCGNRGCLEAYISETAARKHLEAASPELQRKVAMRRSERGGGYAEAVFGLGEFGHRGAETIASLMIDVLGAAIASAVNILDLTTIVIGGGIAPAVFDRMPRLREAAAASLFARPVDDLKLVAASRGPLAGAIGAARLGMLAE
jgi:glucokinase